MLGLRHVLTILVLAGILARGGAIASDQGAGATPGLAPVPPMGWNSYDARLVVVTERQVKANADYVAQHLSRYGYKYIVIDGYWYYPNPVPGRENQEEAWEVAMEGNNRFLPALNRFPSAAQ